MPPGDIYESQLLYGFDSRPLREDELHSRIGKTEHSLKAEISYFDIPVSTGDDDDPLAMASWPVLLPSSMEPGKALKPTLLADCFVPSTIKLWNFTSLRPNFKPSKNLAWNCILQLPHHLSPACPKPCLPRQPH